MAVVIIVSIITASALALGGAGMLKCADNTEDRSVGFRTGRALAGQDQWSFANRRCGIRWLIEGIFFLGASLVWVLAVMPNVSGTVGGSVQLMLLILEIGCGAWSAVTTELKLKDGSSDPS
ncbi:MAG: SdpI family protein [Ruminococcus sp.]|nr:SdpI family protein [Ruminococcus sp.]